LGAILAQFNQSNNAQYQGHNEGRASAITWVSNHCGGYQKVQQHRKLYFLQWHICFRKTFRIEHGGAKLAYCPRPHL